MSNSRQCIFHHQNKLLLVHLTYNAFVFELSAKQISFFLTTLNITILQQCFTLNCIPVLTVDPSCVYSMSAVEQMTWGSSSFRPSPLQCFTFLLPASMWITTKNVNLNFVTSSFNFKLYRSLHLRADHCFWFVLSEFQGLTVLSNLSIHLF